MNDYLRPFPCKNCLVVASCIGRLSKDSFVDAANVYSLIVNKLCSICDDLEKFITPHDYNYYDYILHRRQETCQFYLEKIEK
jgi:hypothetical protein